MLGNTRLFPGDIGHEPVLTPRERTTPRCPDCGEETWELVRDRAGETVGCLGCMNVYNAAEDTEQELIFLWNGVYDV